MCIECTGGLTQLLLLFGVDSDCEWLWSRHGRVECKQTPAPLAAAAAAGALPASCVDDCTGAAPAARHEHVSAMKASAS
jgi:hypothetical protein